MKNRQNRTFRVRRKEIFLNFPSLMWEEKLFISIFLLPCGKRIFFPVSHSTCKKGRGCLPISLLNGHSVYNEKSEDENQKYTVKRKLTSIKILEKTIICEDFNAHHS